MAALPRALLGCVLAACALLFDASLSLPAAQAYDVELDSQTTFRAYEVRSPAAAVFWVRRRLVQTLELDVVQQLGTDETDARLRGVLSLRLDRELGDDCFVSDGECFSATDSDLSGGYQPLADDGLIELPHGYIEATALPLGGELRVGRVLQWDLSGFSRVDGGRVKLAPTPWLAADVLGGLLVRATSVAGSDAFVPQGVPRLELTSRERERARFIAEPRSTPVLAAGLELGTPALLRGRVQGRLAWSAEGTLQREVSLGGRSQALPGVSVDAHGSYDLLSRRWLQAQAGARAQLGAVQPWVSLERRRPRFDFGTIWAFFLAAPTTQLSLGTDLSLGQTTVVGAALNGRRAELSDRTDTDFGGSLYARADLPRTEIDLNAFVWDGGLGAVWGIDVHGLRRFNRWLSLLAGLSVFRVDNPLRAPIEGTSVAQTLGLRAQVTELSQVEIEASHARSGPVGSRFSVLASLFVGAWR